MNIFVILVLNFVVYIFNVNFRHFYFLFAAGAAASGVRRKSNALNCGIPWQKHTVRPRCSTAPPYSFVSNPNAVYSRTCENFGPKFGHYRTAASHNESPIADANEDLVKRIKMASATLLDENISKAQFLERLAGFGREIYAESPTPSVFQTVPGRVDLLKKFNFGNLEGLGTDSRGYFLAQLPPLSDYNLLEDCSSSVYLSVHVDPGGAVYVDGVSDSLIYKGLISLLVMHINGRNYENLDFKGLQNAAELARLTEFGAVRNDAVDVILKHIKAECEKQLKQSEAPDKKRTRAAKPKKRYLTSNSQDRRAAERGRRLVAHAVAAQKPRVRRRGLLPQGLCTSDDIKYASEVAREVGVTLHVLPFSKAYRETILREFFERYRNGETPNPDVLCNSRIKFGEFLRRATEWGFTHVASGHYATLAEDLVHPDHVGAASEVEGLARDRLGRYRVKRLCLAKDGLKDQTYFLSRLTQAQLAKLIFPLGALTKAQVGTTHPQVRELARTAGLPSFNKKDSVGLCFLENLDFPTFLANKLGETRGNIVDYATNEVIGEHTGLFNYTIGQRRNINQHIFREFKPCTVRHVVKKDTSTNTLYVTDAYHSDEFMGPMGIRSTFKLADVFWNAPDHRKLMERICIGGNQGEAYKLRVKVRHSPKFHESVVNFSAGGEPTVHLSNPDSGIATGQFCVFYLDNYCIGSGKMVAAEI